MLAALKQRLRSLIARPLRPELNDLATRIDNLEHALHRDLAEVRNLIDSRAFAMAQLVSGTDREILGARITSAEVASESVRELAVSTRDYAEAASSAAMAAAIAAAHEHAESAVAAASRMTAERIDARLGELRQQIVRLNRRTERREVVATGVEGEHHHPGMEPPASVPANAVVDDLLYLAIEDRFRGDAATIERRQERYVSLLPDCIDPDHPLLDLGCGRGEMLTLLANRNIPARGIDSNVSAVEDCLALGLDVTVGDLLGVLRQSRDDSFGAITMFHVVEHLPFAVLAEVFEECARVLRPGGLLIAETPNALNIRVAATNFWLDPTHIHPLHPELLRLLAERAGFGHTDDLFLNDIGLRLELPTSDDALSSWAVEVSRSLDGPGDYALLAWKPRASPR